MFTDRFIKVPVQIYSVKNAELTGKRELESSWIKFLPFELSDYGPTADDDDDVMDKTGIHLKSGHYFTAFIKVEEFEKLLNDHSNI